MRYALPHTAKDRVTPAAAFIGNLKVTRAIGEEFVYTGPT